MNLERIIDERMMKITSIKEIRKENRPYEKFLLKGPEALTDSELLAIIIRTGTYNMTSVELSDAVLSMSKSNNILGITHLSLKELQSIKGIGLVKATQIKCVAELSRRISKGNIPLDKEFISPEIIANYYMEDLRHLETERLLVVMLNTKHRFLGDFELSKGTVNASMASPREAFIEALRTGAVYIILLHNHPSGDPTPSREDVVTTKRMKEAGNIIGINLIDHIIIGDNKYISLKQIGLF